jgi:hypothetical protein
MSAVFIVDTLTALPGKADEVLNRYLADYAPEAEARGMSLRHRWLSPPVGLGPAASNTLTFVWSVEGVAGWWRARLAAVTDPAVAGFWAGVAPLLADRSRRVHGEAAEHV